MTVANAEPALTDEVDVPAGINAGLSCLTPDFLAAQLGAPREQYSTTCQPVTNRQLASMIRTASVGPFRVTGLAPAVDSLRRVLAEVGSKQPDVYAKLGTAGMLCCRMQRGSTKISSHSWGTAIDLTLSGKLDIRGNRKVHYGLTLIAPTFNRHGWFWGAAFRTEDAMHFEVSRNKLGQWQTQGFFRGAVQAPGGGPAILKKGEKGPQVRLLQVKLALNGIAVKDDGDFGDRTEVAVKTFQMRRGLKPDGIVGPVTRRALGM